MLDRKSCIKVSFNYIILVAYKKELNMSNINVKSPLNFTFLQFYITSYLRKCYK